MGRTGRVRYLSPLDAIGYRWCTFTDSLYVHAPKTCQNTYEHDHHSWSQTSYTAPPTTKIGGHTPNTYTNMFQRHRHGGGHVGWATDAMAEGPFTYVKFQLKVLCKMVKFQLTKYRVENEGLKSGLPYRLCPCMRHVHRVDSARLQTIPPRDLEF
jgi:hypothetical protein